MFKKGQLVKTVHGFGSVIGVVERESTVYPGSYIVRYFRRDGLTSTVYFKDSELELIGNNFKFKGAK